MECGDYNHFRTLNRICDEGWLGMLNSGELRAWFVLFRHADNQTGECDPAVLTVARKGGMNPRTAERALQGLQLKGLLETVLGGPGGRGKRTVRRLVIPENPGTSTGVYTQTPAQAPGLFGQLNPGKTDAKPRQNEQKNPVTSTGLTAYRTALTTAGYGCAAAAAGLSPGKESGEMPNATAPDRRSLMEELKSWGIGEPRIWACANVPGLTPLAVRILGLKASQTASKNPPGWMVGEILGLRAKLPDRLAPHQVAELANNGHISAICGQEIPAGCRVRQNDGMGVYFGSAFVPAKKLRPEALRLSPRSPVAEQAREAGGAA